MKGTTYRGGTINIMRNTLITLLTTVVVATASNDAHKPKQTLIKEAHQQIRIDAYQKWGEDYTMVAYSINRQKEAFSAYLITLDSVNPKNVKPEDEASYTVVRRLLQRQRDKWGNDYIMVMYCFEREMNALIKLTKEPINETK